jgi:hypothetical protein
MNPLEGYRQQIEGDLAQCREALEPLESGKLKQYTRREDEANWTEITSDMIAFHKRNIALYEAVLAALRRDQK